MTVHVYQDEYRKIHAMADAYSLEDLGAKLKGRQDKYLLRLLNRSQLTRRHDLLLQNSTSKLL